MNYDHSLFISQNKLIPDTTELSQVDILRKSILDISENIPESSFDKDWIEDESGWLVWDGLTFAAKDVQELKNCLIIFEENLRSDIMQPGWEIIRQLWIDLVLQVENPAELANWLVLLEQEIEREWFDFSWEAWRDTWFNPLWSLSMGETSQQGVFNFVKTQLFVFESCMKREKLNEAFTSNRPDWMVGVLKAQSAFDMGPLLLSFQQQVGSDVLHSNSATKRRNWESTLSDNDVKVGQVAGIIADIETHVLWSGVIQRWRALRPHWIAKLRAIRDRQY